MSNADYRLVEASQINLIYQLLTAFDRAANWLAL